MMISVYKLQILGQVQMLLRKQPKQFKVLKMLSMQIFQEKFVFVMIIFICLQQYVHPASRQNSALRVDFLFYISLLNFCNITKYW